MTGRLPLLVLLALSLLSGCDEMADQPKSKAYGKSGLFADGMAMQSPPEGTMARGDPALLSALDTRPEMSLGLLRRGQERYSIYCVPCHDAAGYGHGTIPSRGFPTPPSFHIQRLKDAPTRYYVDVITHGHGAMYSYADRVEPADRWAIAAYIRALQLSQDADADALSGDDLAQLGERPAQ